MDSLLKSFDDVQLPELEPLDAQSCSKESYLKIGYGWGEVPFSRKTAIKRLERIIKLIKNNELNYTDEEGNEFKPYAHCKDEVIKCYEDCISIIKRIKEDGQNYI